MEHVVELTLRIRVEIEAVVVSAETVPTPAPVEPEFTADRQHPHVRDAIIRDARLRILKILDGAPNGRGNVNALEGALGEYGFHYPSGRFEEVWSDLVTNEMAVTEDNGVGITVLRITQKGSEHSRLHRWKP